MALEAFYLNVGDGRRFCLLQRPDGGVAWRGAVLYLHPFAEEMNKSRRMAALQARSLAEAGYGVLQIDLHGCGDSSGDFGDASWASWQDDARCAALWLRERSDADLWWWGLRAGALLACAAARGFSDPARLLLWQPVISGKSLVQQFLRLRLASELVSESETGGGRAMMAALRAQLAQGESVEIGGYRLSPSLAAGLEQAELALPPSLVRAEWFELSTRPDAGLSPAAQTRLAAWRSSAKEARLNARVVCGPAFWQTVEISECPQLIRASLDALAGEPA